jgi:hypothetical protein
MSKWNPCAIFHDALMAEFLERSSWRESLTIRTQAAIRAVFDRISEFSEFCHGNDPEMHHSDTAWFRFPDYGFIRF